MLNLFFTYQILTVLKNNKTIKVDKAAPFIRYKEINQLFKNITANAIAIA